MSENIYILPIVSRIIQGETLPIEECQHVFIKKAIKEGNLIENRSSRTIKTKKYKEEK